MTENELIEKYLKKENLLDNLNTDTEVLPAEKVTVKSLSKTSDLKSVWEVEGHLQCPLIGGCLTIEEHRRVLSKAGCPVKMKRPYQLHHMIMGSLNNKNRVSSKVDNFLKHKYRKYIPDLKKLDEYSFMEKWEEALVSGDIESLYYVAAIRRDLSCSAIERIFGDVHMINHINLHEINKVKQRVAMHESTNVKLSRLFKQQKTENIGLRKEISLLKNKIKDISASNTMLKKQVIDGGTDEADIRQLQAFNYEANKKIKYLEDQLTEISNQAKRLEREKRKLEIKGYELESRNRELQDDLRDFLTASPCGEKGENCNEDCPNSASCQRRILIVGGRTRMKKHYKNIVESQGQEFEYHDGYIKGGRDELENRIRRSDLVFCPVNCNSHGACESVKKFCRRYGKPFKMLNSSSLSSIARAISESASN